MIQAEVSIFNPYEINYELSKGRIFYSNGNLLVSENSEYHYLKTKERWMGFYPYYLKDNTNEKHLHDDIESKDSFPMNSIITNSTANIPLEIKREISKFKKKYKDRIKYIRATEDEYLSYFNDITKLSEKWEKTRKNEKKLFRAPLGHAKFAIKHAFNYEKDKTLFKLYLLDGELQAFDLDYIVGNTAICWVRRSYDEEITTGKRIHHLGYWLINHHLEDENLNNININLGFGSRKTIKEMKMKFEVDRVPLYKHKLPELKVSGGLDKWFK